MIDIEKERERTGYKGKPQQWQYGFDLAMSIAQKAEAEKCVWREKEFLGIFHAGCDNLFELSNSDSLVQNKIYYCPFCGKQIDEFGESEDD